MAPQQLASTVVTTTSPYNRPPVESIDEVIDRLEQIQAYAEAHEPRGQHDGVACFSYLYTGSPSECSRASARAASTTASSSTCSTSFSQTATWPPCGQAFCRPTTCRTPGRCCSSAGRTATSRDSSSPQPA